MLEGYVKILASPFFYVVVSVCLAGILSYGLAHSRLIGFWRLLRRHTSIHHTPKTRTYIALIVAALLGNFLYHSVALAAGTVFATNGSTQIGTFPSSLPNNSFRINSSSVGSTSITSTTASFVGSSSATLSPTTGWTQVVSSSVDDGSVQIPLGFTVGFNGTNYTSAYVGSNTYITFGSGSSLYSGLAANVPALPGVHMCAADNSYQKVFYKLDSTGVMRVRYEGNNSTSGTVGSPTIIYEAVFYSGQSYFDVHMGSNSRCGGDTTAPTITSVSSDKANGSYKAGEVIDIDVTFSEAVTSTGNVTVTLETGATDRTCTFTISNATTGTCNYTVQAGDTSADLTVNSVTGTIRDAANNALSNTTPATNLAANKALVIDTTAPVVSSLTSSLANGSYKSGQVVPVQVVFSEAVTVAGGTPQLVILTGSPVTTTLNYASGSGTNTLVFNYTVTSGNYSSDLDHASTTALSLNGATLRDAAGSDATLTLPTPGASGSLAANKALVIDNTTPSVALTTTAQSLTNAAIPVTATFSESVTGFVVGDISVTNGTAGSFSGSGASYAFTVTPSGQGAVSIGLLASVAQDTAANLSSASNTLSLSYDSVAPTVAVTTAVSSPTLQTPIPFTATFSETVTGMSLADITVTAGTAGNFQAVSSTIYTFDVSPIGHPTLNVEVYVSVAANKAQDAAGNNNTASGGGTPYNIRFDNHQPTVTLSTNTTSPTNASPIPVTVTFSESVTGFVAGDLTVTNATAGSFSGSGTTYTFNLTPSGQGMVGAQVLANVAQDGASNLNLVSNSLSLTYDSVAPTVSLTSSASATTNTSPIPVTATFSESVTGFVLGDISVTNGTVGSFTGSGATYTFTVTPSGQGTVSVQVNAAAAADDATNTSSASSSLSRVYDSVGPVLAESSAIGTTTDSTPSYTFTSTEAATVSYSGDCSSATSSLSSGSNLVTFAALADGSHANCALVATDAYGNVGAPLIVTAFSVDNTAPTVTLSTNTTSPTNTSPIPVTVTFSESVTGFEVGDISVTNGTAGSFAGSGMTYSFDITPSGQGAVTTQVPSSSLTDIAGNPNDASNALSVTYDSVVPTVVLTSTAADPTNVSPIPVTATFSESVTQFALGDIAVTNGSASALTGSGATYSFSVIPSGQGQVSIEIPLSSAQDTAGNLSDVSNTLRRTYDTVTPTVQSIAFADSNLTHGETTLVTITFAEAVINFSNSDITTIDNGVLTAVVSADDGVTWTATLTPTADLQDTSNILTVTHTGLTDLAGNAGVDKTDSSNYVIETRNPTITSVSSDKANGSYKAGEVIDIDVTFSEVVTSTGNVTVTLETGATDRTCTFTVSSATTGTCNYTVQAGDTSADLTVNSVTGTIRDAANNALSNTTPATNLAANKALVIDTTAPVVSDAQDLKFRQSDGLPAFSFVSSEAGSLTITGPCQGGTVQAQIVSGYNEVTLSGLGIGNYSGCLVYIWDAASNVSDTISLSAFRVSESIDGDQPNYSYGSLPDNLLPPVEYLATTSAAADEGEAGKIILNRYDSYVTGSGKQLNVVLNQVIYFMTKDDEHSITITGITDEYVTFVLASKPQQGRLRIGETGRYDVDADGREDVEVTVLATNGNYAGLIFKQLNSSVPPNNNQPAQRTPSFGTVAWLLFIVGAIIATYAARKKRRH